MGLIMLLTGALLVTNLVTQSPYKALHFVVDSDCDDGLFHAAARCPHYSNSRDTASL
jgi:hypothetical protein